MLCLVIGHRLLPSCVRVSSNINPAPCEETETVAWILDGIVIGREKLHEEEFLFFVIFSPFGLWAIVIKTSTPGNSGLIFGEDIRMYTDRHRGGAIFCSIQSIAHMNLLMNEDITSM